MVPELPHELYEHICCYLDGPGLQKYSLTCRQFHSIAQRFTFRTANLTYPGQTDPEYSKVKGLFDLAEHSPRICEAVRSVTLVNKRHVPRAFVVRHRWDDPVLCSLLSLLNNVKNFGMENIAFGHLRWTSTSMTVQDALTRTFHSDMLTHLALYRIADVPLDVIDSCSALEELSLELVDFLKQDMDAFFSGTWEPRTMRSRKTELKSLRVTLSDPLFHFISLWITSPVCNLSVASLQRFAASMTMEYYDHGNVDRILQACAATVQIFCFSPTFRTNLDDVGQTMNPINISGLSSLRILRLRVGVLAQALRRLNTHARQSYLQWIVELLSQLPSSTAVTEISLKVSLVKEREMAGVNGVVDMDPWHRLDDLLAAHAEHSIRQFKFIALEEEFHLPDDAARIIRNAFPQLQEARILIVEMSKAISGFFCAPDDGEFLERVKIR